MLRIASLFWILVALAPSGTVLAQPDTRRAASLIAARGAVEYLTDQVSDHGGYLWRYSADRKLREGEGIIKTDTVWVQPPGTPSVGEAFVHLYEATGEDQFRRAAMQAAEALREGQMRSGGWQASVEFEPARRAKWAYRINAPGKKQKDQSSLDDDKTQSALRFLVQLDRATRFEEPAVHETAIYGLNGLLEEAQFPNGGFPQVWGEDPRSDVTSPATANYPGDWPRIYPGHQEYWFRYTLNDHLALDVMTTLLLAAEVYEGVDPVGSSCLAGAMKLGDFLIAAQMPLPQPAWAQQYNFEMQPIWARKFEPPAITGSESQSVIEALLVLYAATGQSRYLEPIEPALDYLQASALPDGQLARFYELQTNRPLYFNRGYQLTYSDTDMPTHYGFKVANHLEKLRKRLTELKKLSSGTPSPVQNRAGAGSPIKRPSEREVDDILGKLNGEPIWITQDQLRFHRYNGPVIDMKTVVGNLHRLAAYLTDPLPKP